MVALQDGQAPKAFAGSTKVNKNRKGLVVLPPEEVTTSIVDNWSEFHCATDWRFLPATLHSWLSCCS